MDKLILDLLVSGSLHAMILVIIIVLWRENRRLMDKIDAQTKQIENVRQNVASVHAVNMLQNDTLRDIKAQTDTMNDK